MSNRPWRILLGWVERIGTRPSDTHDIRLQKTLVAASTLMMSTAGIGWGLIYIFFSEPLAASIPFAYSGLSFVSITGFALTGQYRYFRFTQMCLSLLLPFLVMLALGGFVNSSGVVLWSLTFPLGALVFAGRREAIRWFAVYIGLIAIGGGLDPFLPRDTNLPPLMVTTFFVLNIVAVSVIVFVLLHYFVAQRERAMRLLQREQERSEALLLNVLPQEVAEVLKSGAQTIADYHEEASVLFADIVGFTSLTERLSPASMIDLLNEIFSHFDSLVEELGLEKIRTIGDNYMVASGVPRPRTDHAQALARMALAMNEYAPEATSLADLPLKFRIGINSGPMIAGVVGHKKFQYDIWGDSVNIASRMESHGVPGKIQITRATYERIRDDFICAPRGSVSVKGKGEMETWYLEDVRR